MSHAVQIGHLAQRWAIMASVVYVLMWNLPGCLPVMEPMTFSDFNDAKQSLVQELVYLADTAESPELATEADNLAQEVNLWSSPDTCTHDGYIYSITEQQGETDKTDESLKSLIVDNRDMLGRRYYPDISYVPTESDQSDMPVKYGMSDFDRKQAQSHGPDFSHVSDTKDWNVRFAVRHGGFIYFAGPDGFVWVVMDDAVMPEKNHVEWGWGNCVAAHDFWFFGAPVEKEAINFGWYLARYLSDLTWRNSDISGISDITRFPVIQA